MAFSDAFTAWEVEPGASARGHARDIIEGLAERFAVMIVASDPDGEDGMFRRRVVGPQGPHSRVTSGKKKSFSG